MIRRARYEEDFQQIYQCDKRKIIVYGAGNELKECIKKFQIYILYVIKGQER